MKKIACASYLIWKRHKFGFAQKRAREKGNEKKVIVIKSSKQNSIALSCLFLNFLFFSSFPTLIVLIAAENNITMRKCTLYLYTHNKTENRELQSVLAIVIILRCTLCNGKYYDRIVSDLFSLYLKWDCLFSMVIQNVHKSSIIIAFHALSSTIRFYFHNKI